ncbi:unnamed protein product [Spirodela intermedia]|uniref:Uncharacterized protein n=1 Tax=Spirodela intermedia TaxID=51605 RepID=A0A7I8KBG2_SPIIN|nr:unnamed protein product [Spirodela intermedia]
MENRWYLLQFIGRLEYLQGTLHFDSNIKKSSWRFHL